MLSPRLAHLSIVLVTNLARVVPPKAFAYSQDNYTASVGQDPTSNIDTIRESPIGPALEPADASALQQCQVRP